MAQRSRALLTATSILTLVPCLVAYAELESSILSSTLWFQTWRYPGDEYGYSATGDMWGMTAPNLTKAKLITPTRRVSYGADEDYPDWLYFTKEYTTEADLLGDFPGGDYKLRFKSSGRKVKLPFTLSEPQFTPYPVIQTPSEDETGVSLTPTITWTQTADTDYWIDIWADDGQEFIWYGWVGEGSSYTVPANVLSSEVWYWVALSALRDGKYTSTYAIWFQTAAASKATAASASSAVAEQTATSVQAPHLYGDRYRVRQAAQRRAGKTQNPVFP